MRTLQTTSSIVGVTRRGLVARRGAWHLEIAPKNAPAQTRLNNTRYETHVLPPVHSPGRTRSKHYSPAEGPMTPFPPLLRSPIYPSSHPSPLLHSNHAHSPRNPPHNQPPTQQLPALHVLPSEARPRYGTRRHRRATAL